MYTLRLQFYVKEGLETEYLQNDYLSKLFTVTEDDKKAMARLLTALFQIVQLINQEADHGKVVWTRDEVLHMLQFTGLDFMNIHTEAVSIDELFQADIHELNYLLQTDGMDKKLYESMLMGVEQVKQFFKLELEN